MFRVNLKYSAIRIDLKDATLRVDLRDVPIRVGLKDVTILLRLVAKTDDRNGSEPPAHFNRDNSAFELIIIIKNPH